VVEALEDAMEFSQKRMKTQENKEHFSKGICLQGNRVRRHSPMGKYWHLDPKAGINGEVLGDCTRTLSKTGFCRSLCVILRNWAVAQRKCEQLKFLICGVGRFQLY
jgi:hypothetical protein